MPLTPSLRDLESAASTSSISHLQGDPAPGSTPSPLANTYHYPHNPLHNSLHHNPQNSPFYHPAPGSYAPSPYTQSLYGQNPYAQGPYLQNPYAHNPYFLMQMHMLQKHHQKQQQQVFLHSSMIPPTREDYAVPPPSGGGGAPGNGLRNQQYDFEIRQPLRERLSLRYDQLVARFYKASMTEYKSLLVFLKWFNVLCPVVTVLLCHAIGMSLGHQFSQYPVPYLSHVGAEYPEKGLFIFGLSLSSAAFIPVLFANQAGLLYLRTKKREVQVLAHMGVLISLFSATTLILLACFDVDDYSQIHWSFAVAFFITSLLWEMTEAGAHALWYREDPMNYQLTRSLFVKFFIIFFHSVAMIVFVATSTIESCDLFMNTANYTNCPNTHIISAISQYIVLALVLLYISTVEYQKYEDSILSSNEYHAYNLRNKNNRLKPGKKAHNRLSTESQTKLKSIDGSDSEDYPASTVSSAHRRSVDSALGEASDAPSYPPPSTPRHSIDAISSPRRPSVDAGASGRRPSMDATASARRHSLSKFPTQPIITDDVPEEVTLRSKKTTASRRSNRSNLETQFEEVPMGYPVKKATDSFGSSPQRPRSSDAQHRRGSSRSSVLDMLTPQEPSAPSVPTTPSAPSTPSAPDFSARRRPSVDSGARHPAGIDPSFYNVKPF